MAFFDYIANIIGADYNKKDINLSKKHSSYNEKQLKAIRWVSKKVDLRRHSLGRRFYLFNRFYTNMIRYGTMFVGKYLPDSMFDTEPLIRPEELKAVRDYYKEDWQAVVEYAKKNNP